jgi:Mg-chelatase subunit ChlD
MEIPLNHPEYQLLEIQQPEILILLIPAALILTAYITKKGKNKTFLLTRLLLATLLITALATPHLIHLTQRYQDTTTITILVDQSQSMQIFTQTNITQQLQKNLEARIQEETGLKDMVKLETFSQGNKTELGNTLYNHIKKINQNHLILLYTDGNNNYGMNAIDVAKILGRENITVCPIQPTTPKQDIYIQNLRGDRKTPINSEYLLTAEIRKNKDLPIEYELIFRVNNEAVKKVSVYQNQQHKEVSLKLNFPQAGLYKLEAVIKAGSGDYYSGNNIYRKIVEVAERPNILLLSKDQSSPLKTVLEKNYDIIQSNQPEEILKYSGNYDAIYVDNIPYMELRSVVETLHDYVIDGNGLVVVGGSESFNLGGYNNSNLETLLPVISTEEPEQKRQPIAVIFCMDISASLGSKGERGYETYLAEGKAIAINLLRQLNPEDSVSVLAFNIPVWSWPRDSLVEIGSNKPLIEDHIAKLKITEGGTSFTPVLTKAEELLRGYDSGKYVIFISDGYPTGEERYGAGRDLILNQISSMAQKDINFYTISIGDRAQAREGMPLMQDMAREGNGLYFWMEEDDRLQAVFKEEERKERDLYHIGVFDSYHFITRNIAEYVSSINEYNGVTAKSIAQRLIVTEDKAPVLTVWRYGIGRVAALSTDNGKQWALNLYTEQDGRLISALSNWAIGNLEKNKKIQITTTDGHLGQTIPVSVRADNLPTLKTTYKNTETQPYMKQTGTKEYQTELKPQQEGFHTLRAEEGGNYDLDGIALNYPIEYQQLGVNQETLSQIAEQTGGRIYNTTQQKQIEEDALKYAQEKTKQENREKTDLAFYLLIAALAIYFLDALIRRIHDIIKSRKTRS